MRRALLAAGAAFALLAGRANAAITVNDLISAPNIYNSTTTTWNISTTADCPAGAAILVSVGWVNSGGTASATTSASDTLTGVSFQNGGSNVYGELLYGTNITHLANGGTIAVTFSAPPTYMAATAVCITGVSAVDYVGTQSTGSDTHPTNTTGTLSQASEIVFASYVPSGSPVLTSESGGFTTGAQPGYPTIDLAWKTVSATAAVAYTATIGSSTPWVASTITFKASGAGGVVCRNRSLMGVGC